MKNIQSFILNTAWSLVTLLLCILCVNTSCSEETTQEIPTNWVTIDSEALTVSHEGGKLSRELTLTDGINPSHVYIISTDEWCLATIDEGSKINITVDSSNLIVARTSKLTLIYDNQHKIELGVTQEAAPPTLVTSIQFPEDLTAHTVNMGETFNLNKLVTVLPENASTKTLAFTIVGSENVATLNDGILKTQTTPGTIKVKAIATDGSGVTVEKKITIGGVLIYDRTGWTVSTSITYTNGQNYVTDGTTGKPEDILDHDLKTYLSLVKPGKTMSGYSTPIEHKLSFTVDMKEEKQFNFFQWGNRSSNAYNYLRIWGVTIYGSHDGTIFNTIEENIALDYGQNTSVSIVDLQSDYTYRYIKVEYTDWSDLNGTTSGSSLQVAAFGTGMKYK